SQMQIIGSGRGFPVASRCTNPRRRLASREELDGDLGCPWIDTAPRTASFRLRAAHSGGEDRRLAEWRRPPRTPAVARVVVLADPWPTKGASGMRDSTPGRTSRACTRKLR